MSERGRKVEEALSSAQAIHECVESLSNTQEQAMPKSFGIYPSGSGSDSGSESDLEGVENESEPIQSTLTSLPSDQELLQIKKKNSQFNWFDFVCRVSESCKCDSEDDECCVNTLEGVYPRLIASDIPKHQELLSQSHEAFVTDSLLRKPRDDREAAAFNGEVVSDIDSEDPEDYVHLENLHSKLGQAVIMKRRKEIHRRARYLRVKEIAEQNYLGWRTTSFVRGILKQYPDIGKEIEDFVQQCNVGEDQWRRTGVLTFDGNTRVKQKVTYGRIREHLQAKYMRKFSYSTVVQLCVPRNCRRRWSK